MSLVAGSRLGVYDIVALIGAGGMGEVYRARDTRLDRTVAVKVLPTDLAGAPELRERLEREARTIAGLSHPHICTLHDLGEHEGVTFLVMEYLEGETLQARLQRGALPFADALEAAIQIAEALAAAHRSGVIHRDLKPGNIMLVRRGGRAGEARGSTTDLRRGGLSGPPYAKLLDFGLAKAAVPIAAGVSGSMLPTTPPGITAQGTILGTFHYMAPEQLEGMEADARSDIFAFGAVLYEMVTGKRAFDARSHASLIAAVLEHEPPPFAAANLVVPPQFEHVVRRCLAKNPDERWQTASDLHRELKWCIESSALPRPSIGADASRPRFWHRSISSSIALAAVVLASTLSGVAAWLLARSRPDAPVVTRTAIILPASGAIASLDVERPAIAISPAGTHIAFVASVAGEQNMYLRPIGKSTPVLLTGTQGALGPFFSPDGQWAARP